MTLFLTLKRFPLLLLWLSFRGLSPLWFLPFSYSPPTSAVAPQLRSLYLSFVYSSVMVSIFCYGFYPLLRSLFSAVVLLLSCAVMFCCQLHWFSTSVMTYSSCDPSAEVLSFSRCYLLLPWSLFWCRGLILFQYGGSCTCVGVPLLTPPRLLQSSSFPVVLLFSFHDLLLSSHSIYSGSLLLL